MNPHHLRMDRREWLENICIIPVMFSVFPIPLAMDIVIFSFFFKDGCWPLPTVFFTWLAIGCYLIYLNERDQKPPKWARKVFRVS